MTVKNKWNNKLYTVISINNKDNTVTLKHGDGSEFTIKTKELYFNYKEVNDEFRDN